MHIKLGLLVFFSPIFWNIIVTPLKGLRQRNFQRLRRIYGAIQRCKPIYPTPPGGIAVRPGTMAGSRQWENTCIFWHFFGSSLYPTRGETVNSKKMQIKVANRMKIIIIAFSFIALQLLALYEFYQHGSSSLAVLFRSSVYSLSKIVPVFSSVYRLPYCCTPETCNPTHKGSDLDQLRVYRSLRATGNYSGYWCGRAFSFRDECNKAYSAEFASVRHNVSFEFLDCCVVINIRESHAVPKANRTLLAGGSNFYVLVENEGRRYICDVEDHFNDSYTARCPYYGGCLNVTIFMISYQFTAFESKVPLCQRSLIWLSRNLCPDSALMKINPETQYEGWYTDATWSVAQEPLPPNDTWYWTVPGRNLSRAAVEEGSLKRCLRTKMNSLTFLGDSHLSYVRDYIVQLLGGLLTFNESTDVAFAIKGVLTRTGKVTNVPLGYGGDLFNYVRRTFSPNDTAVRRTFRDVIFICSGFWDIVNKNVDFVELIGISNIIGALRVIRASPVWSKATVAYLSIPPHKDQLKQVVLNPGNNVAISIANKMAVRRISEANLNVTVVDFFSMIYAHYDATADTHHYVRVKKENLNVAYGEIGKVMVREYFRRICDALRDSKARITRVNNEKDDGLIL